MASNLSSNAAQRVLQRVLGGGAIHFHLVQVPSEGNLDEFEVFANHGEVTVHGTSAVALCRGAYHYVRHHCGSQLAWSSGSISLSEPLPDCPATRVKSPCPYRYYLSVCTYGYSMPWWDWSRWEIELDWMAMHGINMPLLLAGQEFVWRNVFLKFGLSEAQIEGYFCGPAYLSWHRLGNLNGHLGPLPLGWMQNQVALQRKILDRARELGMLPVVPGFSGFVPSEFKDVRPDVELMSAEPWAGFEKTHYIDPSSLAFYEVGRAFLHEYQELYGTAHHFLCETFAEQVPQLSADSEIEDLKAIGQSTWQVLTSVDPDAHWVMQGWPFYFAPDYWTPEKTAALFESVPAGRAFILDLATESVEVWRAQPALKEKGWMFNIVHNYGQTTHLHGDLRGFADRAAAVLTAEDKGRFQGMGASPEGIDQNPVIYELVTDLMWHSERVEIDDWLRGYVESRYGYVTPELIEAWAIISKVVYGKNVPVGIGFTWRFRPGDQSLVATPPFRETGEALRLLLSAVSWVGHRDGFRRDLVDVCKTWLGAIADRLLEQATESLGARCSFFEALKDLDRLMATRIEHRLSTWLTSARSMAGSDEDAALLELNARMIVTNWGGPFLFDYATKEWAGLIMDFHAERWLIWFDALSGGGARRPDFAEWERCWAHSVRPPRESESEDSLKVVSDIYFKYRSLFEAEPVSLPRSTTLNPIRANSGPLSKSLQLIVDLGDPKELVGFEIHPVFGQGCEALYAFEVSVDGSTWRHIGDRNPNPTCRGARARFSPTVVSQIRVSIEMINGQSDQLFQPAIFESSDATNEKG